MKKLFSFRKVAIYVASFLFVLSLGLISNKLIVKAQVDDSLVNKLSGKILLQVEENGEAWYLNPDNNLRYFLNRPNDAFSIMRELGLGISEDNYNKFKENGVPNKYSGKILLRVEKNGEAYYINPDNLEMNYLGRPADAFKLMRELGMGINNTDLEKINRYNNSNSNQHTNSNNNQEDISSEEENNNENNSEVEVITNKPELMTNFTHIMSLSADISGIDNIAEKGILYKYTSIEDEELIPTLDDYDKKLVDSSNNNNTINVDITNLIPQTYPHIRAYVIDDSNNIHYGNVETIDSVGKKGTPARPLSSTSSANTEEELSEYNLTYTASEGGYVKLGEMPVWEEKAPLSVARTAPGSAVIDGKIYVVGGTDDWNDNNYFSVYDTETDIWDDTKPLMNTIRTAPLTVELDNKIYVIGGKNDSGDAENTAEVYDPASGDNWEYIASTSVARKGPVGGVYNEEIYVIGGMNTLDSEQAIEIYNPETDTWRDGGSTPLVETGGSVSVIIDGVIYIIGGQIGGSTIVDNLYSYDIEAKTWNTELSKLPEPRAGGNAFAYNNKIYYLGGTEPESWEPLNTIFEYNIDDDSWREIYNLPKYIHRPALEIVGDYLYLIGGKDSFGNSLDSNYRVKYQDLINNNEEVIAQTVYQEKNGITVEAVPDNSHTFVSWSDGSTDNPRTDLNVISNIDVTANFELIDCGDDVTFTYNGSEVTYGVVLNQDTGKCWLDRNLGADRVAESSIDSLSYGDLFQWGRGDDGHQATSSSATSTLSLSDNPGHSDFITNTSNPNDWRSPQNDNLWQGETGINNPCPSGFRLPTYKELLAEINSWSSNNSSGAFGSPLKWSVAGSRRSRYGSFYAVGSFGFIWSSSVSDSHSSGLEFWSSGGYISNYYRARGGSVRCLRD